MRVINSLPFCIRAKNRKLDPSQNIHYKENKKNEKKVKSFGRKRFPVILKTPRYIFPTILHTLVYIQICYYIVDTINTKLLYA